MNAIQDFSTVNSLSLFGFPRHNQYIDFHSLFFFRFNIIPNSLFEETIDCKKAHSFLVDNYGDRILEKFHKKKKLLNGKKFDITQSFFVLDNIIIALFMKGNESYFLYSDDKAEECEAIIKQLSKYKKKDKINSTQIFLLVSSTLGIDVTPLEISKPKLKVQDNYNDDFFSVHKTITERLSKNNDKGLVLLHGKPGTGKTSYIRYLITIVKKKVIFLPPNMAVAITNPDFLSVLIENPNSIFVIEDAENIILDREQNGDSAVSTLLNLSDGLLSDCLNIQIVCSFNTDISKIDRALMRKGRLIAKYEFKELEQEKAQQLSDKLGFKTKISTNTLLTDIYNQDENGYQQEKKKIGFV